VAGRQLTLSCRRKRLLKLRGTNGAPALRLFAFFAAALTILTCSTPSLAHVEKFPPGTRTEFIKTDGATIYVRVSAKARPWCCRTASATPAKCGRRSPRYWSRTTRWSCPICAAWASRDAHEQGIESRRRAHREPDPHLVYLDEVLIVGGGVPIHMNGELIGAIGVAGSPGSVHNEECADAGIAAIAASLA
jgi:Haem degrading protein HbpS-like